MTLKQDINIVNHCMQALDRARASDLDAPPDQFKQAQKAMKELVKLRKVLCRCKVEQEEQQLFF